MKKFTKAHTGSLTELNITPLLDLVIVLMMIFIIASPQLANELEMNLPSATPPPATTQKPPELNYIDIDVSGAVALNRQPMGWEALKPALLRMRVGDPNLSFVVRGHEEVAYQSVITVLDLLQQADITHIGLATESGVTPGGSP